MTEDVKAVTVEMREVVLQHRTMDQTTRAALSAWADRIEDALSRGGSSEPPADLKADILRVASFAASETGDDDMENAAIRVMLWAGDESRELVYGSKTASSLVPSDLERLVREWHDAKALVELPEANASVKQLQSRQLRKAEAALHARRPAASQPGGPEGGGVRPPNR
jgi:hypothetical protein